MRTPRSSIAPAALTGLAGLALLSLGLAVPATAAEQQSSPAAEQQSSPVTDVASVTTPRVPGGQCYPGVPDPAACRRVLDLLHAGRWIYAAGIIDSVFDPHTGRTTSGFSNLFRYDASTHLLDTGFKPQFFTTAGTYTNAPVTGLAASADGSTLYVAGAFRTASSGPGTPGIARKGLAAVNTATGTINSGFDAKVCLGGGSCVVNDVQVVAGTVWIGGQFNHVNKVARTALASVNPSTGALTGNVNVPISGVVTTTTGTKVAKIAINPQRTRAAVIGNFATVAGATHKEVVLLNVDASGSSSSATRWNAPVHLDASETDCNQKDTWARGLDWDPSGTYFDIAASGGGRFNPWPALCDAYSRFKDDGNPNSTPVLYNATGFDSLFTVCDVGPYVYLGGHFKNLNHEVRVNGTIIPSRGRGNQAHYGMGVISTATGPDAGFALPGWNDSTVTGRGAGWASCLGLGGKAASGGGVYLGGDAENVNGNAAIERLAYFPSGS